MKRILILGSVLFATVANAQAPQPTPNAVFTITVTAQELDTIGKGLGKVAFEDAAPLIQKLREQVIAQQKKDEKPVDNAPAK